MPRPYDEVCDRLKRQYAEAQYDPQSGLSKDELQAELARHRAENPGEPRIMTRAWLLRLLCTRARIAVDPADSLVDKIDHHTLAALLREEGLDT